MQKTHTESKRFEVEIQGDVLFWSSLNRFLKDNYHIDAIGNNAIEQFLEKNKITKLSSLYGAFSLIAKDFNNNKTYLLGDRLGRFPVFYLITDKSIEPSLDIAPLIKKCNKNINKKQVITIMISSGIKSDETLLQDIKRLPPGNCAIIENDKISFIPYPVKQINNQLTEHETIEKVRQQLISTINSLPKEGNAILLSGGLDSSILLALCSKNQSCIAYGIELEDHDIGITDIKSHRFHI